MTGGSMSLSAAVRQGDEQLDTGAGVEYDAARRVPMFESRGRWARAQSAAPIGPWNSICSPSGPSTKHCWIAVPGTATGTGL